MFDLIAQGLAEPEDAGCVGDNGFCPNWISENWDRYVPLTIEHAYLTMIALAAGFAIAFGLGVLAHWRRGFTGPITATTGALYTIPSIAAFIILIPITGRGNFGVLIAMVAYSLLILFRNVTVGLRNVPSATVDAARGMGLTARQLLWRVELPLALPEIFTGLRIAATTIVGLLTLGAVFGGGGGLGKELASSEALAFKSNVVLAGGACVLLAALFDLALLGIQRLTTPWLRAAR